MEKPRQIVGFRVGKEDFGVPIGYVHEVVRMMEITSVPDAPSYIEGVINLRGKIIPVIDLRKRFSEEASSNRRNRILVAECDSHQIGLVVDSASEVLRIPPDLIEPPPNFLDSGEQNFVTGVAKLGGRLVILIDLARIMQMGEMSRISEIAQAASTVAPLQ